MMILTSYVGNFVDIGCKLLIDHIVEIHVKCKLEHCAIRTSSSARNRYIVLKWFDCLRIVWYSIV